MNSAPLPIPNSTAATPPFMPTQANLQQILQLLKLAPPAAAQAPASQQQAQPVTQGMVGQVGGANPGQSAPMPGQPAAGGASPSPSYGAITPAGAAPGQPQTPMPGMMQTGFEFQTKGAANNAAVQSGLYSLAKFVNDAANKKKQDTALQAQNYVNQWNAAVESGDQATLDALKNDPKFVSTLKKGLDFYFPEKQGKAPEPQEPPSPEAKGIQTGLQKAVSKKQAKPQPQIQWPQGSQQSALNRQLAALTTQNQIRQQQAAAQQPASPYSPEQQIAIIKAQSEAQVAQINAQKANYEMQKAQIDVTGAQQKGALEAETSKSNAQAAASRAQEAQTNLAIAQTKLQIARAGGKITPATQAKINGAKSALDIIDNITGGKGDATVNTLTGLKNSLIVAGLPGIAKQISDGSMVKNPKPGVFGSAMVRSTPTTSDELKRLRPQIQSFYDGVTKTGTADVQPSAADDSNVIDVSPEDMNQ